MKGKIINVLLIITSLLGYLEWGKGNSTFLFRAEYEVLAKLFKTPGSASHPFTLIPLLGQALLVITLFRQKPGKALSYTGMACIGLLLGFMFVISLISLNIKIPVSTLPFSVMVVMAIRHYRSNAG